jgi:predicted nucleic acid-binding protein
MTAFVDASSLLVLLDADDPEHARVSIAWEELRQSGALLATTNYVALETLAVCQSRLGMAAARAFASELLPVLQVHWVDPETHSHAVSAVLTANRRDLSVVDCTSFDVMRRQRIERALTLDEHFREQGFEVVP